MINLTIAICDPDRTQACRLRQAMCAFLFGQCEYRIDLLNEPEAVLEANSYDLIFLETDFGTYSGIELALALRRQACGAEVILMSDDEKMARAGYRVRAFDYLVKPIQASVLAETLNRFLKTVCQPDAVFRFKNGREFSTIRLEQILYFYSSGRVIHIVGCFENYSYYGKLDDLEGILPERCFLRPHQSYYINIDFVKSYTRDAITMRNGQTIPISRRHMESAEHVLKKHILCL